MNPMIKLVFKLETNWCTSYLSVLNASYFNMMTLGVYLNERQLKKKKKFWIMMLKTTVRGVFTY